MSILNLIKNTMATPTETNQPSAPAPCDQPESEAAKAPEATLANTQNVSHGTKRVHNLIILDESGSMISIYHPALSGVNETLQTIRNAQKENAEQKYFVSLVAFDTSHYNEIYGNTPAEKADDITEQQYRPCGGTPLYDTMGRSISELRQHVGEEDAVLVTVITDGYENASREYSRQTIKALVEEMKAKGWIFTYIGANQDVETVAASMSINNSLAFDADEKGTKEMFNKEMRCRKNFYRSLNLSDFISTLNSDDSYFDE